jgi:D-amino-acid dehydrogenase
MGAVKMDVLVVGAGIIGLTTAYALHTDGHRVTVLDAAPGPAEGASYANGGFLSPAYSVPFASPDLPKQAWQSLWNPASPMRFRPDGTLAQWQWLWSLWKRCNPVDATEARHRFVRLGLYSRSCLEEIVSITGVQFEQRQTGVLQLVRQAAHEARAVKQAESLTAQGFATRWLNRDEVLTKEPGLKHSTLPLFGALHVSSEASGDCALFCHALHCWLRERGVSFEFRQHVTGLWTDSKERRVLGVHSQARLRWPAQAVVVANGNSAKGLIKPYFRLPIQPVKGYSLTARVADEDRAPRHALLDETSRLAVVRFDQRVRLAGVAELMGADQRLDQRRADQLLAAYEAMYPQSVRPAPLAWCGLRPTTPDGPPIISATNLGGLWLNVGHGGYGWTLACGSARLLADLIQGRTTAVPTDDFALHRYARA